VKDTSAPPPYAEARTRTFTVYATAVKEPDKAASQKVNHQIL